MSDDAYIYRKIKDKPDLNSVLEKEEPIGVGMDFIPNPAISNVGRPPKVLFYYNTAPEELSVRTLTADALTLIHTFVTGDIVQLCVDREAKIVFFSVNNAVSAPWTAFGVYKFSYDENSGVPTSAVPFTLIYTASIAVDLLYAHSDTGKLYFNGSLSSTSISRMDYDGNNEELVSTSYGNPKGAWMEDGVATTLYIAETGIGTIHTLDLTGAIPATPAIWFREDSPAFGASTWYDWKQIIVDPIMGEAFIRAVGNTVLFQVSWPVPPSTPTSYPPAYSTKIYDDNGSFSIDMDTYNKYIYLHDNGSEVTYRYYYGNQLMENETIMANLLNDPISVGAVTFLKGG